MDHQGSRSETPADASYASRMDAARAAFPDKDIISVFGGWIAVPKGTVVIRSMFLDGLVEKLREAP